MNRLYSSKLVHAASRPHLVNCKQIERAFAAANFKAEDVVLVHANTSNVYLLNDGETITCPVSIAEIVLGWIREIAGSGATIVMPTYPFYRQIRSYDQDVENVVLNYNPATTPSKTGLISELFRRTKGSVRSPIPMQSLAALGPKADIIIQPETLPAGIPPHGKETPHHRLCLENALVIGVGLELHRYLTLVHVAEDLRFRRNLSANFYRKRRFIVRMTAATPTEMWERRPELARVFCSGKFHRDILGESILHESDDGSCVDWLRAGELMRFMMKRTESSTYPYYLPWLAGPFRG